MSALSTVLAPLIVLGVGAVVFYISDRFLSPQDEGRAETVVLGLAILFLLIGIPRIDEAVRAGPLFAVTLNAGKPGWMLAFVLLTGALAASLVARGRPRQGRAGRLAALGSALLLIWSTDRALPVVAWVLTDVALLYTLARRRNEVERLTRTGFLSLLGAVLLAVGLSLEPAVESTRLTAAAISLLLLALALRLMPPPLPAWPASAGETAPRSLDFPRLIAFLLPAVLVAALGQKFAAWDALALTNTQQSLYLLWASLLLLIGALRAWGAQTPAQLIETTFLYGQGMILCVVGLQLDPAIQLAAAAGAILSVLTWQLAWSQCRYLKPVVPHTWWRAFPVTLALGAQIGLPLTLGFPTRIATYAAIFEGHRWLVLLLLMASEVLLWGALLRILFDLESVTSKPPAYPASQTEVEGSAASFEPSPPGAWLRRLAARPRIARTVDAVLDRVIEHWLPAVRRVGSKIEPGYIAGAIPALLLLVLGLFPNLLSQGRDFPGLFQWLRIPQLPVWAALLLPAVGSLVVYRRQASILRLFQDWWPLVEQIFGLEWLYRAIYKVLGQLRGLISSTTLVIEGAGYMAWVVLVCLIILIFVVSR